MKTITNNKFYNLSPQEQDNFTGIVDWKNGHVEYRKNGKFHREDGPAVVFPNGLEYWYFEGKRHRIGGPAFLNKYDNIEQYWVYGQKCTKEAHDFWVDLMILKDLK